MKGDRLYLSAENLAQSKRGFSRAFELLKKAADLNNPKAQYALGNWYLHGRHVNQDLSIAVNLLRKAADQNHPQALFDLAICYEKGQGVEKDLDHAFECYLKASLWGDEQSIHEVGRCFCYGIGIGEDKIIAELYLDRAEHLGING